MTPKPAGPHKKHFLIVKHGALGDVVRTSYFTSALRRKYGGELQLSWVTAPASFSLLRYNPSIDNIWTDFSSCRGIHFDRIYSLDDEMEIIENVMQLKTASITGAVIHSYGPGYTNDAAGWFDMGLLSRYGKEQADRLKKLNTRTHGEIFSEIFDVARPRPEFWGLDQHRDEARALRGRASLMIGINPYAGRRWPSKELPAREFRKLITYLLDEAMPPEEEDGKILLFGAGNDRRRNLEIIREIGDPRLSAPDTDDSVLRLAAFIGQLDYLVTSDALALHLAIAQQRPFMAFFAPTSAAEIDTFGLGAKLRSTAPDYCSYRKDADNSSITADRIFIEMATHRPDLFEHEVPSNVVPLRVVR
jgi:heptosyltransferase-2